MKVYVTPTHILKGQKRNPVGCPVVLAITDATNHQCQVYNEVAWLWFTDKKDGPFRKINLPRSAKRFIKKFDENKQVQPFCFIFKA